MEKTLLLSLVSIMGSLGLWMIVSMTVTPLLKYDYCKKKKLIAFVVAGVSLSLLWLSNHQHLAFSSVFVSRILISIVFVLLIEITFIDFKYKEIPDSYNLTLFIISVAYMCNHFFNIVPNVLNGEQNYMLAILLSGFIGAIFYLVIYIVTGGALGMGDVKMSLGLSILSSTIAIMYYSYIPGIALQMIIALKDGFLIFTMYAFGLGAIISLMLLVMKIKKRTDKIAFGPYIALGFFIFYSTVVLIR